MIFFSNLFSKKKEDDIFGGSAVVVVVVAASYVYNTCVHIIFDYVCVRKTGPVNSKQQNREEKKVKCTNTKEQQQSATDIYTIRNAYTIYTYSRTQVLPQEFLIFIVGADIEICDNKNRGEQ